MTDDDITGKLCWVTALMVEAKPLIDHYDLRRMQTDTDLAIFSDEIERIWLVVSGIGKQKSAVATNRLYLAAGEPRGAAWMNMGIAGHRERDMGELRWVNKIEDFASGKSWYPPRVFKVGVREASALMTVDKPGDYPDGDTLVDMEASGFYMTATQFSTRELVQCVKLVSDNENSSWRDLKKGAVEIWIRDQMDEIATGAEELLELSAAEMKRCAEPIGNQEMLEQWHFTETEKHLLRRILRRRQALIPDSDTPDLFCRANKVISGAEALKILREALAQIGDEMIFNK